MISAGGEVSPQLNVLLSSAGRRVELVDIFRRTLKGLRLRGEVMAADVSRAAPALYAADRALSVPPCTEEGFIQRVMAHCEAHHIDLIIPTIDTELAVFAEHREAFAQLGVIVAISCPETIAIAADKNSTHRWLRAQGFPTVDQATVKEVLDAPGLWPFPLLVKPVRGSRSQGVAIVHSREELIAATMDDDYIVQSIAPGEEYTVSFFAGKDGRCRCAIPRKRLEVRSGEVSKGLTVRNERVEALAFEICNALPGAYGALNVQIFHDPATDALNVIEINPRFGGGFPLAWQAGGDYPRWMIEELLGLQSTASHDRWEDGLMMMRYDRALYLHEDLLRDGPSLIPAELDSLPLPRQS